jgi:hypothetical protein
LNDEKTAAYQLVEECASLVVQHLSLKRVILEESKVKRKARENQQYGTTVQLVRLDKKYLNTINVAAPR